MTRKPATRPVTVAGRKPAPVTLAKVTYRFGPVSVTYLGPLTHLNPIKEEYENRKRFTVRVWHHKKHSGKGDFVIWDKARDSRGGFLYREALLFPKHTFRTRAAAKRYLRTTTTENEEYRLEMLNRALDGQAA